MDEESGEAKDLLGLPLLPQRDRRGRRKLRFPEETYVKVEDLRGLGMVQEDIALAIGVSVPTLRKYFFPELKQAAAKTKAEILSRAMEKVREGSVPAMRLALSMVDEGNALPTPAARQRKAAAADPPLGKKAAAVLEAHGAHKGTEWDHLLKH